MTDWESLNRRVAELEAELSKLRQPLPVTEMFAAIIQASPLAIVALTSDGNVTLWNNAAERTFGWTAAEVIGHLLPFIPAEKLAEHREMRQRDLSGEGFRGREIRRRRKDGRAIDLSVSTAPIRDAAGRVVGIMSIYIDVTEQKATQDALAQQAELLELNHDAVIVWKLDGAIEFWNAAAEALYGYSKTEAIGRVSHELFQTEGVSGSGWLDELRAERRWEGELNHATKDGRRIVVDSRQSVVRRLDGADIVLETNRDVTDRVRAAMEIRVANEALRRANGDLEQFAYAAAHDLQEPLRNMAISSELLARELGADLAGDSELLIDTIVAGARRMQNLVNDLLEYTRSLEAGAGHSARADLRAVLDGVEADLAQAIEESGAEIVRGDLPVLPMSPAHLSQLLTNLIGNAIKYAGGVKPVIHVSASRSGDGYRLCVTDNGPGIPAEYRERVFGLFKRLNVDVPGTGLGLAICKKMVEHYDGRIWVEDGAGGVGSTFCVLLPA